MSHLFAEPDSLPLLAARESKLLAALDKVIERRRWTERQRRDYQLQTLKTLVAFAYEQIPLYREKYAAAGFQPAAVESLDDLALIPPLTKEELRRANVRRLRSADEREPAWLLLSSGSTGVPSRIYRSDSSLWNYTAYDVALYYDWCRGRPIEECLYFVVPPSGKIGYALADLLRTTVPAERLVAVNEPANTLQEKLDQFLPEYLSSYPSTMRNLAFTMRRQGRTYDRLRLLHLTSEGIDGRTRSLLADVFPCAEIVQTYTSTEGGLMAYQCVDGALHVLEDNAIVEIVDAAGQSTNGPGEVVVTDLTNWATPIIRYSGLGDLSRWDARGCSCGAGGRVLANLDGRSTELILRPDGAWMSPYLLTNALEKNAGIHHCQIIQYDADRFEIRVVRDSGTIHTDGDIATEIKQSIVGLLQSKVTCGVQFVSNIPPQGDGHKVPLVISHVRRNA